MHNLVITKNIRVSYSPKTVYTSNVPIQTEGSGSSLLYVAYQNYHLSRVRWRKVPLLTVGRCEKVNFQNDAGGTFSTPAQNLFSYKK